MAWKYLGRLIDLQIEAALGKQYQPTLALVYREESGPEGSRPLTSEVFTWQEGVMARLLQVAADLPEDRAKVASRFINGSIIAFGEHKSLIAPYISEHRGDGARWLRGQIKADCLAVARGLKAEER